MNLYQREFLDLAIEKNALRFGEFTLKSGRVSPYFFNAGAISSGGALARLGNAYAKAVAHSNVAFDMIFGPAYKGIALAAATAIALHALDGRDMPVAFDRKEAKAHGEGGVMMGAALRGRVLIVDDVITAGTAIRHALQLIESNGATPAGVLIALDRQERGENEISAVQEVESRFRIPVIAIARLEDLIGLVRKNDGLNVHQIALEAYRRRYCV